MTNPEGLFLPALKGRLGIRFYYLVLMTLGQVAKHIKVGEEIYSDKRLSKMIQRELRSGRSEEISRYLTVQDERFFNAMVVGVYAGAPDWKAFRITAGVSEVDASSLALDTVNSFGFLALRGDERLFPLDGQHRLAGIRAALETQKGKYESDLAKEEIAVIFIPHDANTDVGRERSRRLFTVLNKRAKPVDKNEIIALDEDDVMAITTRAMVERYRPLMEGRVAYTASANLPPSSQACFTTIGTLYDVLYALFLAAAGRTRSQLENNRPPDDWVGFYFHIAKAFFDELAVQVKSFAAYTGAADFAPIARAERHDRGGNLLFRPAGLRAFTEVVAALVAQDILPEAESAQATILVAKRRGAASIRKAVQRVCTLPLSLDAEPYRGTLWDVDKRRIQAGKRTLVRDLMLDMLGVYARREALRNRYARAVGREGEHVMLPSEKHAKGSGKRAR